MRYSGSGDVDEAYRKGSRIAMAAGNKMVRLFGQPLAHTGVMSVVRVARAISPLPTEPTYRPARNDDWPGLLQFLDECLELNPGERPKIVFVSISISGIAVGMDAWRSFGRKYVAPLGIKLYMLVRQEWPQSDDSDFINVRRGMKVARYDLTAVLSNGPYTAAVAELREWLYEQYDLRGGNLDVDDAHAIRGINWARNLADLLI